MNDELMTMVEREVLGCLGIRAKSESDDLDRRTDPITALTAIKPTA